MFASMALASHDRSVISRYNTMALEYLAKAGELDAGSDGMQPPLRMPGDDGGDMDRD